MNITDQARDELMLVLKSKNEAGIRLYFNGFG